MNILLIIMLFVHCATSDTSAALHEAVNDAELPTNKYSAPRNVLREVFSSDNVANQRGTCDHNVHLLWQQQTGSSIFATPAIVDIFSDGTKDLLIPTFTHYVEAMDGRTGEDVGRFPFMHPRLRSQVSPLAVDLDGDGIVEWMISTYSGELLFLHQDGQPFVGKTIRLKPMVLKRDWYLRSTVKNDTNSTPNLLAKPIIDMVKRASHHESVHFNTKAAEGIKRSFLKGVAEAPIPMIQNNASARKLMQTVDEELEMALSSAPTRDPVDPTSYAPYNYGDMLDDEYYGEQYGESGFADEGNDIQRKPDVVEIGADGWLSDEAKRSMDLVFHSDLYESSANSMDEEDVFSPRLTAETVVVADGEIAVDPHILATPVLLDSDHDGNMEALIHVSYYFDPEQYAKAEFADNLPDGVDISKYVASALVCIDLKSGSTLWEHLLHVTTKDVEFPTYALSHPLVFNIDGDAVMDVFVATSLGYIVGYDFNGHKKNGWPVTMGPIIGSPIAVDVNGDGEFDLCASDIKGNLACFNKIGHELMHINLNGEATTGVTAGDVNGDGYLDLVFGTTSGNLYAIDAKKVAILPGFPLRTDGPILSPPLLLNLNSTSPPTSPSAGKGLHIVVPSHDGQLYIVSGTTGCYETIDIGEKSYSMVLADDITGNNVIDLVVTTMSGSVLVFETATPFHPLKRWASYPKTANSVVASEGYVGIFIEGESRITRDVRGDRFKLLLTIVDERSGKYSVFTPHYFVVVTIGGAIVASRLFLQPQTYSLDVQAPLERMYGTVNVMMFTQNGVIFADTVSLSFNMHFLETIKYLVVIPFFFWCLAISFVRLEHTVLPERIFLPRRRYQWYDEDDV